MKRETSDKVVTSDRSDSWKRFLLRAFYGLVRTAFLISIIFSILNVSINGNSFYFYMILPLADFSYVRSMLSLKISRRQMYAVFFILASSLVSAIFAVNPTYFLKPMFSVLVVTYLLYMYKYRYATFRWIYVLMAFSCLFGCVQMVAAILGVSKPLQPGNIAGTLWGQYGILARNGFEDGVILPYRVSGLSKEPGFFSSLLVVVAALAWIDDKLPSFHRKMLFSFFFVGFIISFSKISAATVFPFFGFVLAGYVIPLRKASALSGFLVLFFLQAVIVVIAYRVTGFQEFTYLLPWEAETYLHRTIGYYIVGDCNYAFLSQIILTGGITEKLDTVVRFYPFLGNLRFVKTMPSVVFLSSGFAYVLLQYGLGLFVSYLYFFKAFRVRFYPFLFFFLATSALNPLALENTVIIGYVMIILASIRSKCRASDDVRHSENLARI